MVWNAYHQDHSKTARHVSCPPIRYYVKKTYGLDFPPATLRDIEIPPFCGDDDDGEADKWMESFEIWAVQENLHTRKKIQLVHLGLFGEV